MTAHLSENGANLAPGRDPWRQDARIWAGLVALVLGLLLLERGFAGWRNDPRNFPGAHGIVAPKDVARIPHGILAGSGALWAMGIAGAGFVLLSVGLFAKQLPLAPGKSSF